MQLYEKAIKFDYPIGSILDNLSEDERDKANIVGGIIDKFVERHKIKDEDRDYNDLFDKFYDKDITELIIYKKLIDIDF